MTTDIFSRIPADYPPQTRVWIYQSDRTLPENEAAAIEDGLNLFCSDWKSHGAAVRGAGFLLMNRFIVLLADETRTGVSGCSTDSSVKMIRALGENYGIQFFDRLQLAFLINGSISTLPLSELSNAFNLDFINQDTPYFNNSITTLQAFKTNWMIPLKDSWLVVKIKGGMQAAPTAR